MSKQRVFERTLVSSREITTFGHPAELKTQVVIIAEKGGDTRIVVYQGEQCEHNEKACVGVYEDYVVLDVETIKELHLVCAARGLI